MVCKYFLLFCKLLLSCFVCFFFLLSWWCPESTKVFKFWWRPNSVAWAFGVTFKKASPYPRSQRVYSCFFLPKSLIILAVTFRPITHFKLLFVHPVRKKSDFILFFVDAYSCSAPFVKKMFFLLLNYFGALLRNQWTTNVRAHLCTFSLVLLSCFCSHPVLINIAL